METSINHTRLNIGIALCLALIAISLRLMPHPPNFAPIAAVAIFGGAVLPRRLGVLVPLAAIIITDLIIGMHDLILVTWGSYALIVLGSNLYSTKRLNVSRPAHRARSKRAKPALLRRSWPHARFFFSVLLRRTSSTPTSVPQEEIAPEAQVRGSYVLRWAFLVLASSVFFFLATNFAVWLTSGMYAHTWAGLVEGFTLALPFFRNTLLSDMVYTAGLFMVYALAVKSGALLAHRTPELEEQ